MSGNRRRADSGRSIQGITSSAALSWALFCRLGASLTVIGASADAIRCAESRNNSSPPLLYPRGIARVTILKDFFLALLLLLLGSIAVAQQTQPLVMRTVARARLRTNLRARPLSG